MVAKRARNTAVRVLIAGGVIVGVIIVAQRFGIGGRIIEGFGGLGQTVTGAPLEFIKAFAQGAGDIGEELRKVSENFQRSLSGGLLLSEQEIFGGGGFPGGTITEQTLTTQPGQDLPEFLRNAFKVFEPPQPGPNAPDRPAGSSIFDVASAFTREAQEFRVSGGGQRPGGNTTQFGGFGSAQEQEAALQRAIAESRQRFSQFFRLPGE